MGLFKKKEEETKMQEREDGLVDYDVYIMTKKEKTMYIILAAAVIFAVMMIFYENVVISLLMALFAFKFPKIRTKQIIAKRKSNLNIQFKDMLYSISSSMQAGRSIENAFAEAMKDMQILYPDPETPIMAELAFMIRELSMSKPIEDVISEFAQRTHIDDIINFADVIRICKRSGGNLVDVVRSTSNVIGDKIETKNEIETLITAKKFESRILCCTPIAMVLILSVTSYDYIGVVFNSPIGIIATTVAIAIFVAAFFIGEKIMKIEV